MAYCPTTMPFGSGWDKPKASEKAAWYQPSTLYNAWGNLITAALSSECDAASPAFIFDLVDVGREYLSVTACNAAYIALTAASTPSAIRAANATMVEVMTDIDRLLAASGGFLLGQWINDARAVATSAGHTEDADFLEWNGE